MRTKNKVRVRTMEILSLTWERMLIGKRYTLADNSTWELIRKYKDEHGRNMVDVKPVG